MGDIWLLTSIHPFTMCHRASANLRNKPLKQCTVRCVITSIGHMDDGPRSWSADADCWRNYVCCFHCLSNEEDEFPAFNWICFVCSAARIEYLQTTFPGTAWCVQTTTMDLRLPVGPLAPHHSSQSTWIEQWRSCWRNDYMGIYQMQALNK